MGASSQSQARRQMVCLCPSPTSFLIWRTDTCSLTPLLRKKKKAFSADPDSMPLTVNKKLDFCPQRTKLCKMLAQIRLEKENRSVQGLGLLFVERALARGTGGRGSGSWAASIGKNRKDPSVLLDQRYQGVFLFCFKSFMEL